MAERPSCGRSTEDGGQAADGGSRTSTSLQDERPDAQDATRQTRIAFLLQLSDALRALHDPVQIQEEACTLLCERLNADRVTFADIEAGEVVVGAPHHGASAPGVTGRFDLASFGSVLLPSAQGGHTICIPDIRDVPGLSAENTHAYERLGVRSFIAAPLVKEDKLSAVVGAVSREPRQWSELEIGLVEEVAARTWDALARARAEAELRDKEAHLETALQIAGMGTWHWSPNRDRVVASDVLLKLLGVESAGTLFTSTDVFGLLHPEDVPRYRTVVQEAVAAGTGWHAEFRIIRPSDGEMRWVEVFARETEDPVTGEHTVDGLLRDITDTKEAELALRESEARFRLTTDSVPQIVWITDGHGALEFLNRRWYEYTGTQAAPLTTQELTARYIHPEDRERSLQAFEKAKRDGITFRLEHRLRAANGEYRWFMVRAEPCRETPEGEIVRWFGASIDIHDRRLAQQALAESEARFRQFSEASPDVLWIRDADTLQFEHLSPAFDMLYGTSRETMFANDHLHSWTEFVYPDDRPTVLEGLRAVREGKRVTFEFRIVRPNDGEIRWVRNTDFPLLDASGRVQRIAGIAQDITAYKHSEERQAVLLAELQHRVRNTLAMVSSLVRRTVASSQTVEEVGTKLLGRINALARTQALLTRSAGIGVPLDELVLDEILPQCTDENRVHVSGPEVHLAPKAAEVLTLAIHELATNATKHGALGSPNGNISVRWHVEKEGDQPWLRILWLESGVHRENTALAAGREGFGTELITKRVPYELRGRGRIEQLGDAIRCTIEFPLKPGESVLQPGTSARRQHQKNERHH